MHTALPTYLALSALLSQTATAFYPYLPQDIDISDSTPSSSISRRIPRPSHSDTSRTLTLPLRRVATPPLSLRARQNAYKILESADPKQENSVAIDQDGGDLSYMIAVRFGDGKEEYHLLLDSAASNTWVMAQDCTSESCRIHDTFGEGDSSTLTTQTTPFNITYGTGSVSGTLASDTLRMGTLSPTLTFGLATTVSQEFRSYPMDGILGLGRGTDTSTSTAPTTPPHSLLDALFASRQIPAKIYGIHLSRDGAADGEINLGAVNRARFTGEINYMPLIENETGFWEVRLDEAALSIDINGVETTGVVFSKDQTQRTAILDTGTSPLLIPPPDSHALHALIPNAVPKGEVYYIPCRTSATLTLTFNGVAYRVPSAEWIAGPDDNSGSSNGGVRSPNGELLCRSRIIGRQTFGPGAWLVGSLFLGTVYSVFEAEGVEGATGGGRVGFGVLEGNDIASLSLSGTATATATATATMTMDGGGGGGVATATASAGTASPAPSGAGAHASSGPLNGLALMVLVCVGIFSLCVG